MSQGEGPWKRGQQYKSQRKKIEKLKNSESQSPTGRKTGKYGEGNIKVKDKKDAKSVASYKYTKVDEWV